MPSSWSQATAKFDAAAAVAATPPLTDINPRNQLDLLGCYPREFGGGGNQSIWRQGKRRGQSSKTESKLHLRLVVMFCLRLRAQDNSVFFGFHFGRAFKSWTFSDFLFFHVMVMWRLAFLSACWWKTKKQLRTGIFRGRHGSGAIWYSQLLWTGEKPLKAI